MDDRNASDSPERWRRSPGVFARCDTRGMVTVQNNGRTTRPGGVTGAGFVPGQSGNPGGRPRGLSRRVRELVGDDGELIAQFMITVMNGRGPSGPHREGRCQRGRIRGDLLRPPPAFWSVDFPGGAARGFVAIGARE